MVHIYHNSSCIITFQYFNSLIMVLFSEEKMAYLGIFASFLKYLKLLKINTETSFVFYIFLFFHCYLILSISGCLQMTNVI